MNELPSKPIAEGRTAEVYLWNEKQVLKLYRDWCPPDWVDYEARIAHAVYESGVPSPKPGEILEVQGRRGLIYERLLGGSMLQDMNARPWMLFKHARALANLHVQVHRRSITGLPLYRHRLKYDIDHTTVLDEGMKNKALARLEHLPDGETLCHGDYHPGNVLLASQGPVVIDWMTACSGSPWADVARTSLILSIGAKAARKQVSPLIRMAILLYNRAYLQHYRGLKQDEKEGAVHWTPVIAAARLSENIVSEREALIKIVKEGLEE